MTVGIPPKTRSAPPSPAKAELKTPGFLRMSCRLASLSQVVVHGTINHTKKIFHSTAKGVIAISWNIFQAGRSYNRRKLCSGGIKRKLQNRLGNSETRGQIQSDGSVTGTDLHYFIVHDIGGLFDIVFGDSVTVLVEICCSGNKGGNHWIIVRPYFPRTWWVNS